MSDLFIEVDEALKQERLEKLWKEYGGLFLSFLAMIVLVTAANAGYSAWIKYRNVQQTNLYLDVTSKKDMTADDLLAILPKMTAGMKGIVSMRAAGLALESKDTEKALSIYKTIESDPAQQKNNPLFVALSKYMAINLNKEMSPEEKVAAYDSIAQEKNNPWRYNAMMDAALIEATQNNNYAKAREYLSRITEEDSNSTQALKQKAQSLDILYEAESSKK